MSPTFRIYTTGALALLLAACAGTTIGSGVGDAYLERPPFYAGAPVAAAGRVAHLPIAYQRGATQAQIFEPADESGSPIAALLREMNAYLDSLGRVSSSSPHRPRPADAPT